MSCRTWALKIFFLLSSIKKSLQFTAPMTAKGPDTGVPRAFLSGGGGVGGGGQGAGGIHALTGWQVLLAEPFVQTGKMNRIIAQWAADSYVPAVCPLDLFSV